jgi:hypothetical protein
MMRELKMQLDNARQEIARANMYQSPVFIFSNTLWGADNIKMRIKYEYLHNKSTN